MIKGAEPFSKQPTQVIIAAHNCHNSALTDQSPNSLNSLVSVIYQLQKKPRTCYNPTKFAYNGQNLNFKHANIL